MSEDDWARALRDALKATEGEGELHALLETVQRECLFEVLDEDGSGMLGMHETIAFVQGSLEALLRDVEESYIVSRQKYCAAKKAGFWTNYVLKHTRYRAGPEHAFATMGASLHKYGLLTSQRLEGDR